MVLLLQSLAFIMMNDNSKHKYIPVFNLISVSWWSVWVSCFIHILVLNAKVVSETTILNYQSLAIGKLYLHGIDLILWSNNIYVAK